MKITEILTREVYDAQTGKMIAFIGMISISHIKIDFHLDSSRSNILKNLVREIEAIKQKQRRADL